VLCTPDLPREHLERVAATAAADAIVIDPARSLRRATAATRPSGCC